MDALRVVFREVWLVTASWVTGAQEHAGCIGPAVQTAAGAIGSHDIENKVIYSEVEEEVILHGA